MAAPSLTVGRARVVRTWVRAHGAGLALGLIVSVGLLLRIYQLGAESYWFDEIFTLYDVGGGDGPAAGVTAHRGAIRSSAYLFLASGWVRAFGTSEAATRALSVLCGTVAIVVTYLLGKEWLGRRVGLIGAALLAVSEFQIHYAQDFRFYAPLLLFSLLSFWAYIKALAGARIAQLAAYVIATLLALYTHTHAVFFVAAQGAFLLVRWRSLRATRGPMMGALALVVAGAAPMALRAASVAVAAGSESALGWISDPPVSLIARTLYWYVLPLRHERSWSVMALAGLGATAVFALGSVLFVRSVGPRRWLARLHDVIRPDDGVRSWRDDRLWLVGLWALLPIAAPFVLSKIVGPMYTERYTIAASPAWYLLIGWTLVRVRRVLPEYLPLAALAVLIVPGLAHYYAVDVKEQWRDVAAHVEAHGAPGDVIVVAPNEQSTQERAFGWYYDGTLPICAIDAELEDARVDDAYAACCAGHGRCWLIVRGPAPLARRFREAILDASARVHVVQQMDYLRITLYLTTMPGP